MDEKILWLYAQGMCTREIVQAFDEWYGADISPTLISRVTNAVIDKSVEWQTRPLVPFIRLFISIDLWCKFAMINVLSINPSDLPHPL
jgi:transposase-like protein